MAATTKATTAIAEPGRNLAGSTLRFTRWTCNGREAVTIQSSMREPKMIMMGISGNTYRRKWTSNASKKTKPGTTQANRNKSERRVAPLNTATAMVKGMDPQATIPSGTPRPQTDDCWIW